MCIRDRLLTNRTIANYRHLLEGIDLLVIDEAQSIPHIGSILKLIVDEIKGIKAVSYTHLLTNTTLSIVAALGAIMLVGIVTKNGIVLIDFINLMRERGIRLYDAIAMACRSRLRLSLIHI